MECTRCGGELETYTLDGNEAFVCADCGFVDTAFEHEATQRPEPEPWAVAIKRFHEKHVEGEVAITGTGETAALVTIEPDEDSDSERDSDGTDGSQQEREKPA